MGAPKVKVARLSKTKLAQLKAVEKALGCTLVAVEPEYAIAPLSAQQLRKLRAAEKKLGVILLAYCSK